MKTDQSRPESPISLPIGGTLLFDIPVAPTRPPEAPTLASSDEARRFIPPPVWPRVFPGL